MELSKLDLKPLDIIASYKAPETWYERIGDKAILSYGKRCYPDPHYYTRINHIRIVVGTLWDKTTPIGFEWTAPKSRFFIIQDWMLTPGYSRVMRMKDIDISHFRVYEETIKNDGKMYDYLQLLGIWIGWKWLQFGDDYEVCSSGVTELIETLTYKQLFPKMKSWRVPPCAFVNHPEKLKWMNPVDKIHIYKSLENHKDYPSFNKEALCELI